MGGNGKRKEVNKLEVQRGGGEHRKHTCQKERTTSPVEQNKNSSDLGPGLAQGPSQVTRRSGCWRGVGAILRGLLEPWGDKTLHAHTQSQDGPGQRLS